MMSFPSIDELVKIVDTKYTLVTLVAMRARELTDNEAQLIREKNKKAVTIALEEIYENKVEPKIGRASCRERVSSPV